MIHTKPDFLRILHSQQRFGVVFDWLRAAVHGIFKKATVMAKIPSRKDLQTTVIREEQAAGHLNHMVGVSYDLTNPIQELRMIASSCFFGEPTYYADEGDVHTKMRAERKKVLSDESAQHLEDTLGKGVSFPKWHNMTSTSLMEMAIDAALDFDPEKTLEEAARLRNEEHVRTTPQIIMVRAANHKKVKGTDLIRRFAVKILKRADEPTVQLAYHDLVIGGPIPNALKKAWKVFLEGVPALGLAKYRLEGKARTLKQVVKMCHAKGPAFDALFKDTLKIGEGDAWEVLISAKGASKETWTEAIESMGHMALLRNLRNFHTHGVDTVAYMPKLVETAATGKQLPFRYFAAYQELVTAGASAHVLDGVEQCLKESLGRLPTFKGRVMSLCDNSGSAQGATTSSMGKMRVADIANLTAVLTGYASDEGHVGVFGDKLETFQVRKTASMLDQVEKANKIGESIGAGTENGVWLFFDQALKNKERWDHLFVYSDMQAGHGGLYGVNPAAYKNFQWNDSRHIDVAALVREYRKTVNPNVRVYLVQVAGYKDVLVPEFYDKTYIMGGWGEGLLRFASEMANENDVAMASTVVQN